jgi:hypothetical protein
LISKVLETAKNLRVPGRVLVAFSRFRSGGAGRESTDLQNQLPSLSFREFFLVSGHGLATFADFVKEFTVRGVGKRNSEISWTRVVERRVMAVTFAGIPVARGTFVQIDGMNGIESGFRRWYRILHLLGTLRNGPLSILQQGVSDGDRDYRKEQNEEDFASGQGAVSARVGGHQASFAYLRIFLEDGERCVCRRCRNQLRAIARQANRSRAKRQPEKLGVEEENDGGDGPGDGGGDPRICEFAHASSIAGELHQRNHGEGQLKT